MKYLLSLSICIISFISFGQIPTVLKQKIDSIINQYHTGSTTPGVSVSVYYNQGNTFQNFTKGISYDTISVTPNMNFSIGSNTKMFTSLTLLKLQENGFCSISDSIGKYLTSLPPTIDGKITIKQLLTHKSGLNEYINTSSLDSMASDLNKSWMPQDLLDKFVGTPVSTPGGNFNYINTNYLLAGMIIESISGKSYLKMVDSLIFTPNGINGLYLMGKEPLVGDTVHAWDNGLLIGINGDITNSPMASTGSFSWAAGGMWATPNKLAEALKKIHLDKSVLNTTSYSELLNGYSTGITSPFSNYGLGLFYDNYFGMSLVFHTGSWYNLSAMIVDKTSKNIVVVAINNTEGYTAGMDYTLTAFKIIEQLKNFTTTSIPTIQTKDFQWIKSNINGNITLNKTAKYCSVFNMEGKLIHSSQKTDFINLSDYKSGIYLLNIEGKSIKVYIQ